MSHEDRIPPPARTRRRIKRVTYTLQVTCEKPANMNEQQFLNEVRNTLHDELHVTLEGNRPRVSVLKRTEEFGGGS